MPQSPMATVQCGLCKAPCQFPQLEDPIHRGYPDLDGRPASPMREQVQHWVSQCPRCGYCSVALGLPPPEPKRVDSPAYWAVLENRELPISARRFLAWAMLLRSTDPDAAQDNQMRAAWMCDDASAARRTGIIRLDDGRSPRAMAVHCRLLAAATLQELKPFGERVAIWRAGTLVDALRRAGHFDEAEAECQDVLAGRLERESPRLRFQLELKLIRAKDTACHSSEECATAERRRLEARRQADADNPLIGPEATQGRPAFVESSWRGRFLH
jgi:hypothetical protein